MAVSPAAKARPSDARRELVWGWALRSVAIRSSLVVQLTSVESAHPQERRFASLMGSDETRPREGAERSGASPESEGFKVRLDSVRGLARGSRAYCPIAATGASVNFSET